MCRKIRVLKMPFKFHLKKNRQYNVVSKNEYVVCVELLDQTSIECTLENESLGRDCLDNIMQRLGLGQPEFFGLQYYWRHRENTPHWVDMEKPLKRQLEKDAKSFNLLLRIMYYISDVQLIQDEMTRYHFYLQLKCDVLEGKTQCDTRQATLLASYSMQADFGNYDPIRHTPGWLSQYTWFPKDVIESESGGLHALLDLTIRQYNGLTDVLQAAAEEYYISLTMQLEGYGHETFAAKDEENNQVVLGISMNGIMVVNPTKQRTEFCRWKDISNVINHKKSFRVECQSEHDDAKQFVFGESRSAKYVWRLCIAQHTFYMKHQEARPCERLTGYFDSDTNEVNEQTASVNLDNRTQEDQRWSSYNDLSPSPYAPVASNSSTDINTLRELLPTYRQAPDYETAVQMKFNSGNSPAQPYYVNQSTIVGADLTCSMLGNNIANRNRYS